MKRIYLAGPMSGIPDLNFPAFHAEAARLRALGYDVVNPAEINVGADAVPFDQKTEDERHAHWCRCMKADITELLTCDTLATLDGWWNSRGARLERYIAEKVGIQCCMAAHIVEPRLGVAA